MPSTFHFLLTHFHYAFHVISLFDEFLQHSLQHFLILRLPVMPLPPLRVEVRLAGFRPAAVVVEVGVRSASSLFVSFGVRHRGSAGAARGVHGKGGRNWGRWEREEAKNGKQRDRERWGGMGIGVERNGLTEETRANIKKKSKKTWGRNL